jgi:DNA-binding phage protein
MGMVALSAEVDGDAEFLHHRRQVTKKVGGATMVVQKAVSGMGTTQIVD